MLLLNIKSHVYSQGNLKDSVECHFRMLDSLARENKADTIYTINHSRSIAFMERHTKINASSHGTYYGRLSYTRTDLYRWHQWFSKNGRQN